MFIAKVQLSLLFFFGNDIILSLVDALKKCCQPASRGTVSKSALVITRRALRKLVDGDVLQLKTGRIPTTHGQETVKRYVTLKYKTELESDKNLSESEASRRGESQHHSLAIPEPANGQPEEVGSYIRLAWGPHDPQTDYEKAIDLFISDPLLKEASYVRWTVMLASEEGVFKPYHYNDIDVVRIRFSLDAMRPWRGGIATWLGELKNLKTLHLDVNSKGFLLTMGLLVYYGRSARCRPLDSQPRRSQLRQSLSLFVVPPD
ncbi:hypothetical protein QBC45DRAFT_435225 [Copromyces sp. CBS 386.78]|nr:hypothetical protein QBC45DRAFT_435225 [Copromyces sp. CBS 386.78]